MSVNWLKYMKQEELVDLQINLGKEPWPPPTQNQVDRMLKEIRTAQSERAAAEMPLPKRSKAKSGTKIVCISGSTRFLDEMAVAAWEMEKQGILVIGPHLLPASYPGVQSSHQAEVEGVREILDELHLRKIDLCDEVYVVNVGGYTGSSTKNELEYARKIGKPIRFMEPIPEPSKAS